MSLWYLHKKDSSNKFQKFWWVHRKPLIQISANLTPFIPTPHTLPGLCHPGKVKALRHGPKKWQKAKATKGDPDFWFWILMVKWLVHFLFNCGPKRQASLYKARRHFDIGSHDDIPFLEGSPTWRRRGAEEGLAFQQSSQLHKRIRTLFSRYIRGRK